MEEDKKEEQEEQNVEIVDEDDENEEAELEDMIQDLNEAPKLYEIPKPSDLKSNASNKYAPIPWEKAFPNSHIINEKIPVYWTGEKGPNFICLHGAGHSGHSFAPIALLNKHFRIISYDIRGHGFNTMSHGEDLSQETLIQDTIEVLNFISSEFPEDNIIVVGHSMGGSIATKTCEYILKNKAQYQELYDKIQGLICIDVVEGTAMEALPYMENIVENRPQYFSSINKGIEYMFKNGTIKNLESAKISVPPLLKEEEKNGNTIYSWKTDLMASQKYWTEWFSGLTKAFLSCKIPKILMLAGIERMDKDLVIAQMQGQFQLSVVNDVGHIIHEDDPVKVMKIFEDFVHTFKITGKLSEMKPIIGKLGGAVVTMETIKYKEFVKP